MAKSHRLLFTYILTEKTNKLTETTGFRRRNFAPFIRDDVAGKWKRTDLSINPKEEAENPLKE